MVYQHIKGSGLKLSEDLLVRELIWFSFDKRVEHDNSAWVSSCVSIDVGVNCLGSITEWYWWYRITFLVQNKQVALNLVDVLSWPPFNTVKDCVTDCSNAWIPLKLLLEISLYFGKIFPGV